MENRNGLAVDGQITRLADHPLSLGHSEQKLLAVATVLRHSKGLAILDAPSSGMGVDAKKRLVSLLNAFPKLAVVILTHDEALEDLGEVVEMR